MCLHLSFDELRLYHSWGAGVRVEGLPFRVQGSGFRVQSGELLHDAEGCGSVADRYWAFQVRGVAQECL